MRHVAIVTAIILLAGLSPLAGAYNECTGDACVTAAAPNGKTYYVYGKFHECDQPLSSTCRGHPAEGSFPTPPLGILGVLYEESNGYPGLQRAKGVGVSGPFLADHMLLV